MHNYVNDVTFQQNTIVPIVWWVFQIVCKLFIFTSSKSETTLGFSMYLLDLL